MNFLDSGPSTSRRGSAAAIPPGYSDESYDRYAASRQRAPEAAPTLDVDGHKTWQDILPVRAEVESKVDQLFKRYNQGRQSNYPEWQNGNRPANVNPNSETDIYSLPVEVASKITSNNEQERANVLRGFQSDKPANVIFDPSPWSNYAGLKPDQMPKPTVPWYKRWKKAAPSVDTNSIYSGENNQRLNIDLPDYAQRALDLVNRIDSQPLKVEKHDIFANAAAVNSGSSAANSVRSFGSRDEITTVTRRPLPDPGLFVNSKKPSLMKSFCEKIPFFGKWLAKKLF